jgi:aminoglycoside 3-N-acetyltransferase I
MSVLYKKLGPEDLQDFISLVQILAKELENNSREISSGEYLLKLLKNDNIIILVATLDSKIIGGLTAHILPSIYGNSKELYLYDLAVTKRMQRQGVGRGLITELENQALKLDIKQMYVQADIEDKEAVSFYKATGGKMEKVAHFNYEIK